MLPPSLDHYLSLGANERRLLIEQLLCDLRPELRLVDLGRGVDLLPTLLDEQSGMKFKLIPSTQVRIGLSEEEEAAARRIKDPPPISINEMRPVRVVEVPAFLITVTPVLFRDYARLTPTKLDPESLQYLEESHQLDCPAFVTRDESVAFARSVRCRLPYEAEWECACRATTQTLFVFGDEIPGERELARWLVNDFSADFRLSRWCIPGFSEDFHLACNSFGLYGLFAGEWCQDEYRPSHDASEPVRPGEYVVRGGGALFWPWQDDEWIWCISAMRMPSSKTFDGRCAFRLVRDLPR